MTSTVHRGHCSIEPMNLEAMMSNPSTTLPPFQVGPAEAARLLGMKKTAFYEGLSSGRIGPVGTRIGGKRLFLVEELQEYCRVGCPSRREWLAMKRILK